MQKISKVIAGIVLSTGLMGNVYAADMMKDSGMMKDDAMMADNGMMKTNEAIGGFCPVCVIHGKMMKGSDNFVTLYQGKIYKFPGIEQQKMFLEDPQAYTKDLEMKYKALMNKG